MKYKIKKVKKNYDNIIIFKLTEEEKKNIHHKANELRMTVSEYIRRVISKDMGKKWVY